MFSSVLCLLCICVRLFICALWSPAGKGLTSWLSFVVSNCEFVTFPLVSWVRCGTLLYRFRTLHTYLLSINMPMAMNTKKEVSIVRNTTTTHCRPTHGTVRKSHRTLTVTRHQGERLTSSLNKSSEYDQEVTQSHAADQPKTP